MPPEPAPQERIVLDAAPPVTPPADPPPPRRDPPVEAAAPPPPVPMPPAEPIAPQTIGQMPQVDPREMPVHATKLEDWVPPNTWAHPVKPAPENYTPPEPEPATAPADPAATDPPATPQASAESTETRKIASARIVGGMIGGPLLGPKLDAEEFAMLKDVFPGQLGKHASRAAVLGALIGPRLIAHPTYGPGLYAWGRSIIAALKARMRGVQAQAQAAAQRASQPQEDRPAAERTVDVRAEQTADQQPVHNNGRVPINQRR